MKLSLAKPVTALLIFWISVFAHATETVPKIINYQGKLTDYC